MRMKPSGQSKYFFVYKKKQKQKLIIFFLFKSGLFGLNTIPLGAKEIVITEGEYDAMAVY